MGGPETYVRNAELMLRAFGAEVVVENADFVRFELPRFTRILLRRQGVQIPDRGNGSKRLTIEDSWGGRPDGKRMPVMNRAPGAVERAVRPGVEIRPVRDADDLADAERVIVYGFPQPANQPWVRGVALPERLLGVEGWTAWLARRDGDPAAAGFTYDDGSAVGVYWLATLPEHRSHGLGRAVMAEMLAAHEDRTATLVATQAGEPLYRSLGFATVSMATWYMHVPEQ